MSPALELGDYFEVDERLVLAPALGVVRWLDPEVVTTEGEVVAEGQIIAMIESSGESVEVRSAFGGFMMGLLVVAGERVRKGQPVAWLRAFSWTRP